MSAANPDQLIACPDCNAACSPFADECWLCGHNLTLETEIVIAELAMPRRSSVLSEWFFAVLTVTLVCVLMLIVIGATLQEPAWGIGLAIVILPPMIVTIVRVRQRQVREGHLSWAERFATFLVSFSLMVGLLALIAVGGFVAFLIYCIVAAS